VPGERLTYRGFSSPSDLLEPTMTKLLRRIKRHRRSSDRRSVRIGPQAAFV
jgi:hypothetical protein